MRLAWLTDIHLNFLAPEQRQRLYEAVAQTGADAVALGGDIAEAGSLGDILRELDWSGRVLARWPVGRPLAVSEVSLFVPV